MKERVATHVISNILDDVSPDIFDVGDFLYPVDYEHGVFTSDKMEIVFGNDAGLLSADMYEVVTVEIWNSPLYKALR